MTRKEQSCRQGQSLDCEDKNHKLDLVKEEEW